MNSGAIFGRISAALVAASLAMMMAGSVIAQTDDEPYAYQPPRLSEPLSDLEQVHMERGAKLELRKVSDAYVEYSELLNIYGNDRPTSYHGHNALVSKINAAEWSLDRCYAELRSRVDVQEELMRWFLQL